MESQDEVAVAPSKQRWDFITPWDPPEETFIKEDPDEWISWMLDSQDEDVVIEEEYDLVNWLTEPWVPDYLLTPWESLKKSEKDNKVNTAVG